MRIAWTADGGGGTFTQVSFALRGWIFMVITNPGATAPQDNYDIYIKDEHGFDVMGGTLENRDTANTEQAFPIVVGTTYGARFVDGSLTLDISNNNVANAVGVIDIYYEHE
jgi:hypothetical protein